MPEKYDKISNKNERHEDLSEIKEQKLSKLQVRSAICMNEDSLLRPEEGKEKECSAEYVAPNGQTIRIERNILRKGDTIQMFELSIHKCLPAKYKNKLAEFIYDNKLGKALYDKWTTYKLKVTYDGRKKEHSFLLETNDGFGNKDSRTIDTIGELDKVMSSFDKRLFELQDYNRKKSREQINRMQKLAYDDQKKADTDLDQALDNIA